MKKGFFVNVNKGTAEVIEIEGTLDEYYEMIGCKLIDITSRKIGEKYYDIICDDEGLFAENPRVSAVDMKSNPMLVGNLIIFNTDGMGNETSLTDEDVKVIQKHLRGVVFTDLHLAKILVCEY